jgi:subtilisin family serine protease
MRRPTWRSRLLGAVLAGVLLGAPADSQILRPLGGVVGGLPGVGQTVGGVVGGLPVVGPALGQTVNRVSGDLDRTLDPQSLIDQRLQRLSDLVRRGSKVLDVDDTGNPVVRGEVLAISPSDSGLAAAHAAGFVPLRELNLEDLGLVATVLSTPPGMSTRAAVRRLRRLDPNGGYDFNHLFFAAGATAGDVVPSRGGESDAPDARVGLIDTGVAAALPVFTGVRIEQKGFAPGAPAAAAHGTSTASLVAGRLGAFHGASPGASLYVADVYGTGPTGGSAEGLALALGWMAAVRAPVVNISLTGPANALVAAAVRALNARGVRIVAAVGNDGPAAPPAYPASYPQVIAVTGVDAHDRVLPEAGRALHIDYAAPASQMSAADLRGGLAAVRGTSFAAPIVAGELARLLHAPDPAEAASAVASLDREAVRKGEHAGRGVVGEDVRLPPAAR